MKALGLKGWLSFTKLVLVLTGLAVSLTGCGFTAIHAQDQEGREAVGSVARHLREIEIQPGRERIGQIFYTRLKSRIPASQERLYRLESGITSGKAGSIIESDASISRFRIIVNGTFTLINKANGKVLWKKNLTDQASYNAPRDPFAQRAAQEDAEKRASTALADQLYIHLSVFFERALDAKAKAG